MSIIAKTVEEFNRQLAMEAFNKICLVLAGVHLNPDQARDIHMIIDVHTWPPPERKHDQ